MTIHYKKFTAVLYFDERDRIFCGQLTDTYDNVYFEGAIIEELEIAFREAIDDYLAYCSETGREPS